MTLEWGLSRPEAAPGRRGKSLCRCELGGHRDAVGCYGSRTSFWLRVRPFEVSR